MRLLLRTLGLTVALSLLCGSTGAKPWWLHGGAESNETDFLPPDAAFRSTFRVERDQLRVRWVIADGYYLYRRKMEILPESPDLTLGAPSFPPGIQKTDPYLGTQEIFTQQVEAVVPFRRSDGGAHPLQIRVTYQGCAEAGLCYPPIQKVLFAERSLPLSADVGGASQHWAVGGIVCGAVAFLVAGLLLRKRRRLDTPAA